jgi:hypothetical protein
MSSKHQIYPRESFEKDIKRFSSGITHGVVTNIGLDLFSRFGSTEQEKILGYEKFVQTGEDRVKANALMSLIHLAFKRIKKNHT